MAASSETRPIPAGGAGATRRNKESLADVLRRRSPTSTDGADGRAAAVQFSLQALTRNAEGALLDVPLEDLQPNPFQPRFQFHRQPLEELAQSLAQEGQLEAVIARRARRDGRDVLEIVAGARRLEAAKICNATIRPFPTLRADVRELTDEEAERISLVENLQRENLTPLEEGYRYWQLQHRDPRHWSVRTIADFVHKKKSTVQNRLNLVKDPAVAEAVLREQIPPTAGFHILRLPGAERAAYLQTAIERRLTVEQIKGDVNRRLAAGREPVVVPLAGAGQGGTAAEWDEPAGGQIESYVRGHVRRSPARGTAQVRAARRQELESERTAVQSRIEALEAEVREHVLRLRSIDRELAALDA